jgi:hypothetical protein
VISDRISPRRPSFWQHLLAVCVLAAAAPAACSNSGSNQAGLASECIVNSDCDAPLVCAFTRCHTQCTTTRDCPTDSMCVESDRPFDVCQLPVEKDCTFNSDCPEGQVCGVDSICRDQCKTDSDCIAGQTCTQGTCADPSQLDDAGKLPVIASEDAGDAAVSTQTCVYNSDCPSGMICNEQTCVVECKADIDCIAWGPGYACVANTCVPATASADASGDATLADAAGADATVTHTGGACAYNSDCTPQICASGTCIDQCHQDVDCPSGETCNASDVCVLPEASIPPDAPTGYASACIYNSDCTYPLLCKTGGVCGYQCQTNLDCPSGDYCNGANQCIVGAPPPAQDAGVGSAGEGGAEAGKPCSYNSDCSDGIWCDGFEQCVNGKCYPPAVTPCGTTATCIVTTCNESTQTCTQTVIGTTDADGDGHYDQACGGDDCNDHDPTIYTGHPELCDGKDNDCNGLVDDYAVVARGAEYTSVVAPAAGDDIGFSGSSQATTAAFGTGFVSAWLASQNGSTFYAQTMTTAGDAGTPAALLNPSTDINYSRVVGIGGSPTIASAAIVYNVDVGNNQYSPLYAAVVSPSVVDGGTSLALATPVPLVGAGYPLASGGWVNEGDVHWIASSSTFLVSFSQYNNATGYVNGFFTTLAPDGTEATSPTPVAAPPTTDGGTPNTNLGNPGTSPVYVRSAASGSLFAFAFGQFTVYYTQWVGTAYVTSASGAVIGGSISLPGMPLAVSAYLSGFVVLTESAAALTMTQISSTGAVLNTVSNANLGTSGGLVAVDARGAADPDQGVMFAVKMTNAFNSGTNGTTRLVRARINASGTFDPMEVTTPIQPATPTWNDRIDLSVLSGGSLGISDWEPGVDNAVHVRIASCLP